MQFDLFSWLGSPAFVWGATQLSIAEVLGFATGLGCVWLAARRSIWNFPVGIANSALLLLLFFHARLYADAGLQIFFIALGVRGWWQWSEFSRRPDPAITTANRKTWSLCVAAAVVLWLCLLPLLSKAGGSLPVFDALIASLSVVAQWLLNRKVLQTWFWWIAVDVISVPVYVYKELYLVALLYCVFLALCVSGYVNWRKQIHDSLSTRAGHREVLSASQRP
jgi:nicotinamide mononucleotide transporter